MLLAVLSDTHLSGPDQHFLTLYERHLASADAVLHCGDMVSSQLYHFLAAHPRFYCVRGNCDHFQLDHDLPAALSLGLELPGGKTLRIGMAHGWGERSSVGLRVAELFPDHDLVCYGHTHRRDWSELPSKGKRLNPGSALEGSLALVEVAADGSMTCRFVDLDVD